MAKTLNFNLGVNRFALSPVKVERKKLYGYTETQAIDPEGCICQQAGIDGNGMTIVPKGATKVGMLTESGEWMSSDELQAMHADGSVALPIASSFDEEIRLDTPASPEDLLRLIIASVYELGGEGAGELAAEVGQRIFRFPFSYKGGYEASTAFLLSTGTSVFVLTGELADFPMIGIDDQGVIDEDYEETEIDDEELDFSMF